jgi:salicylate biosynthesis isochorismate synthase/menaquinone-specific isochorismate synthase
VLAGLSFTVDQRVDPSAVAFASRRPGEPWFCFEQPDRDGAALGAVGCVRAIRAAGANRFAAVAAEWRRLADGAEADAPDGPAGAGLVAVGGFAFAPEGGTARHWNGFAAAELIVPEVALARRGARGRR